jgi:hypothetical protein
METTNIIELLEKNPLANLSQKYNNKFLNRITESFTEFEQNYFVTSFYCYLSYDRNTDFVIDFDRVWKYLDFSQKSNAERLLEKYFMLDRDYKYSRSCKRELNDDIPNLENPVSDSKKGQNGGQNIKKIFLTVTTFKLFCLRSHTRKAFEVNQYFVKMEEIFQDVVEEETIELREQLLEKELLLKRVTEKAEIEKEMLKREKEKAVESAIMQQFQRNTECIYFGTIENTNDEGETLIKFGQTNDLGRRVNDHRKMYKNFVLVNAFRVHNKVEVENLMKAHPEFKSRIRFIDVNGKIKTELISYDETIFTLVHISNLIMEIVHSKAYSVENYNRLLKENEDLLRANVSIDDQVSGKSNLESIVTKVVVEREELKEKLEEYQKKEQMMNESDSLPDDKHNRKFRLFVENICIVLPSATELSVNLEGRYRLWSQERPTKEVFHALKKYLDTKFRPKRIEGHHGYVGIKLKTVEYKKKSESGTSDVETFIFERCQFGDCGKILNSVLFTEYQKWKLSIGKELKENDMKDIKDYLDSSPYALKATVWTDQGSNQGYYGLCLKTSVEKPKIPSSTGKKVEKRDQDNNILGRWDTIAQAALAENMSTAKMSRSVKGKTMYGDCYYCVADSV